MFDKTQKFVKDTQYLYTIIQSKEFYDRNGCFYQQTMTRYDSYCNVNEDELVKEVNSSPLQICFDDYKKLLNCVNIPNMDIASMSWFIHRKLSSDRELIEDAIGIYETVIETCGNLRNSVADFMELYGLVDNFPKIGFLCPMFIDNNGGESERNEPLQKLHDVLNISLACSTFDKAIERGWMKKTENGYCWSGIGVRGRIAQLAYMCGRIYGYKHSVSGNVGKEFPDKELCELFNETKIYNQLVQVYAAQKPQKWRATIDELFE